MITECFYGFRSFRSDLVYCDYKQRMWGSWSETPNFLACAFVDFMLPRLYLPASLSAQLRFRLGVRAPYSTSHPPPFSSQAGSSNTAKPSLSEPSTTNNAQSISAHTHRLQTDTPEPRKSITFTCTAPGCSTRSSHTFTTRAYEKGVVLVQCPGCKVRWVFISSLEFEECS